MTLIFSRLLPITHFSSLLGIQRDIRLTPVEQNEQEHWNESQLQQFIRGGGQESLSTNLQHRHSRVGRFLIVFLLIFDLLTNLLRIPIIML